MDTDRGALETPTVREATKRAPYMHDGSLATLREVVELYNRGGQANPYLDPKFQPLNLTEEEIDALVAMMEALEGEGTRTRRRRRSRSRPKGSGARAPEPSPRAD